MVILGWTLGAFCALPAVAEEIDERVQRLEREVAELRELLNGAQQAEGDSERLAEIERRIEILAAELDNLRVGEAAVVADEGRHGFGPAASKIYRTERGVSIGGYGEMLYESYDSEREDGSPSAQTDQLDFLRAVFYFGYKFNDRFLFNSEIEFEHSSTGEDGEVSVEFAYVDYLWRGGLNVRGGLVLLPMGFVNELHEPTVFLGTERPLTETRIIPTTWREAGIGLFGDLGGFTYRTYVVNGFNATGFSAGGLRGGRQDGSKAKAEDFAWVGRLDWVGTPGLTVGASGYFGDSGQDLEDPSGKRIGVGTSIVEGHVEWRWRGLQLRLLASKAWVDDVDELNDALSLGENASVGEALSGAYVELGYDVLARGRGRASLTPFVRWESVNTQVEVPAGWTPDPATDVDLLTVGLAYKPIEQLVIKADYQDWSNGADTGVDQLNLALGYIF